MSSTPFPSIEALIPHRGTMLMIDAVLASNEERSSVRYTPQAQAWYADANGDMPAWIGIELMAQAVAVHVSLARARSGETLKPGVLLGTRRYQSSASAFDKNTALGIHVQLLLSDAGGLAAYECTINSLHDSGTPIAQAQLKVYEPGNFDTFWKEASS